MQASFPLPYRRKCRSSAVAKFKKAAARPACVRPGSVAMPTAKTAARKPRPKPPGLMRDLSAIYIHTYMAPSVRKDGLFSFLVLTRPRPQQALVGASPRRRNLAVCLRKARVQASTISRLQLKAWRGRRNKWKGSQRTGEQSGPTVGHFRVKVPSTFHAFGPRRATTRTRCFHPCGLRAHSQSSPDAIHSRFTVAC